MSEEKRGIYIESKGCFGCQFYSSYDPCTLPNGPDWEEVVKAWRNGGFANGCSLRTKSE